MADWLDSAEFNGLLVAYRMCPGWHQPHVSEAIARIIAAIRDHHKEIVHEHEKG